MKPSDQEGPPKPSERRAKENYKQGGPIYSSNSWFDAMRIKAEFVQLTLLFSQTTSPLFSKTIKPHYPFVVTIDCPLVSSFLSLAAC
jgi:hypothetical protein